MIQSTARRATSLTGIRVIDMCVVKTSNFFFKSKPPLPKAKSFAEGGIIRGRRGATSGRPGACIGVCTGRPLVTESGQGEGTTLQGILGKGTGRFRRYLVLGSLLVTSVTSFKPVQTSGDLLEMYSSSFRRYLVPLHTCLSSVIDMCVVTK